MNKCEKCNIYLNEDTKNCPLCGAASKPAVKKMDLKFVNSEYYDVEPKKPARLIVRNIFIGISVLILCVMAIVAGITFKSEFFTWPMIIVMFVWLTILRFIFWPDSFRVMLNRLSFMLCVDVVFLGLYFSFYISSLHPTMDPSEYLMPLLVVFTYVLPSIILATQITLLFIAAIRRCWYQMSFSVHTQSIFEIIIMIISCSIYYTGKATQLHPYYPIIVGIIGIISIIVSWVFSPKVTLEEFKKRFFF